MKGTAEHFNKFFTEIGPNLDLSSVTFENYLKTFHTNQPEHNISINELKYSFFSLKPSKSLGYDEINFNFIKKCFGSLHKPLLHILNQSPQNEIFPDGMQLQGLRPYLKKEVIQKLSANNCIALLSKVLEKIM